MKGLLLLAAALLFIGAASPAAVRAQGTGAAALPHGHYEGDGHDHHHGAHGEGHYEGDGHDHSEHGHYEGDGHDHSEGAEPWRNAALLKTVRGDTAGLAAGLTAAGFGAAVLRRKRRNGRGRS